MVHDTQYFSRCIVGVLCHMINQNMLILIYLTVSKMLYLIYTQLNGYMYFRRYECHCSGLKGGGKHHKQLLVTVKSFIHIRGSGLPYTTDTA